MPFFFLAEFGPSSLKLCTNMRADLIHHVLCKVDQLTDRETEAIMSAFRDHAGRPVCAISNPPKDGEKRPAPKSIIPAAGGCWHGRVVLVLHGVRGEHHGGMYVQFCESETAHRVWKLLYDLVENDGGREIRELVLHRPALATALDASVARVQRELLNTSPARSLSVTVLFTNGTVFTLIRSTTEIPSGEWMPEAPEIMDPFTDHSFGTVAKKERLYSGPHASVTYRWVDIHGDGLRLHNCPREGLFYVVG